MAERKPGIGSGIRAWGEQLRKSHPDLAEQFSEPRRMGYERVKALGLPRPFQLTVYAKALLQDPKAYFDKIDTDQVFIFLQPESGIPTRRVGISKEEALVFLREAADANPETGISVELSENLEPVCGGNILVKADGAAMMELKKGSQGELSAGTVVPEYRAWQDTFTRLWRYSFEEIRMREMVQEVMHVVPHDDGAYLPGMYEFKMVEGKSGRLEPWFVDFRASDAFVK